MVDAVFVAELEKLAGPKMEAAKKALGAPGRLVRRVVRSRRAHDLRRARARRPRSDATSNLIDDLVKSRTETADLQGKVKRHKRMLIGGALALPAGAVGAKKLTENPVGSPIYS